MLRFNRPAIISLVSAALLGSSPSAFGWGKDGHALVSEIAAKAIFEEKSRSTDPAEAGLARFFSDQSMALSHIGNIPDISWRDPESKVRITILSESQHFFQPEPFLGIPPQNPAEFARYLQKVGQLPTDYNLLKKSYNGRLNPLPGVHPSKKTFNLYRDAGVSPWQTQHLYELMVEALLCAKSKEGVTPPKGAPTQPFLLPADGTGDRSEPPLPTYRCQKHVSRSGDIHAALTLAGLMSHFIGDQAQPFHSTADFDGYTTGNGDIHAFFETRLIRAYLGDYVQAGAFKKALLDQVMNPNLNAAVKTRFTQFVQQPNGVAKMMIQLAINSQTQIAGLRKLDDQFAIVERSEILQWGDNPLQPTSGKAPKKAVRKSPNDPAVMAAFRSIAIQRMGLASAILRDVWVSAWNAAGKPRFDQLPSFLKFPVDPPFIWPAFDREAIQSAKPAAAIVIPHHDH